jgi:uncharacterized membrane protein
MEPAGYLRRIVQEPHEMVESVTLQRDLFVLAHLGIPRVDAAQWQLDIAGLVEHPVALTFDDVRRSPVRCVQSFHQCAGAPRRPDIACRVANVVWEEIDLGLGPVAAAAAFVGTHFRLSHPLGRPIVDIVGSTAFLGLYSAVAAATLTWLALAYRATPAGAPLWPVDGGLWAAATAVMLLASILLMGSLVHNPALPNPGSPAQVPAEAQGVYAVTRHPMIWSFTLWGLCHIAVYPVPANLVLAVAIIILALAGAALQDRKKEALQPDTWPVWERKTS